LHLETEIEVPSDVIESLVSLIAQLWPDDQVIGKFVPQRDGKKGVDGVDRAGDERNILLAWHLYLAKDIFGPHEHVGTV